MYVPRNAKITHFIVVSEDCADTRTMFQQIYLKCKIQIFMAILSSNHGSLPIL